MVEPRKKLTVGTVEAGEILGLSRDKVSKLCREHVFPNAHQRQSGCPWSIPISDIESFRKELSTKKT